MAKKKVQVQRADNGYVFNINGRLRIEKNLTEARRLIGETIFGTSNEQDIDWKSFEYEYEVLNVEHEDNPRIPFESKQTRYGYSE